MPKFIFAYHGGKKPETPEQGQQFMAAWRAWFDGLGGAVADPGNPVGMSKTVTATGVEDNGGSNPLSGYTLVTAADIDAATELAKGCPILDGGSIEVAEVLDIDM